ncbi:[protein-PII] uridylyltransferase [Nocardioides montaniterrae]
MTAADRHERTLRADELCSSAYTRAGGPEVGFALVAVGGYGRGELAPFSDLDVVLVADEESDQELFAQLGSTIWYPLWDSGAKLDHSVRTLPEMIEAAENDIRVAAGALDIRHIAGDPNLTLRVRTMLLGAWRRDARRRLPELGDLCRQRHRQVGELAHLSVPDIKEAEGGLRDATVLQSLTATWLVDVPAADLQRCRGQLLDVRDLLHELAGRGTDRISPEYWSGIAQGLELDTEAAAQRYVRELGRRITHLSRLAWRRADGVVARPRSGAGRRPALERIAPGVALSNGEVVLAPGAEPSKDPMLLLRAAAEAATRDAVLAPPTAARLAANTPPLPTPWPAEARHEFVRLLGAGRGLLAVWETLDETGALDVILPEWERIRLLPHASVIHRFTVDRHVVETCIEASSLIRTVSRPDVLLVAALLHDIGKGGVVEHSLAGAPIAREIAARMGFTETEVDLIGQLVRWHLLLAEVATTRDPDDPATIEKVTEHLDSPEAILLLAALTEADAKAASGQAWTTWRAGLVRGVARRAIAALELGRMPVAFDEEQIEIPAAAVQRGLSIQVESLADGARVTWVTPDRVGLLADVAAVFALRRAGVRAARVWNQGDYAISVWDIAADHLDAGALNDQFDTIVEGRVDPALRLAPKPGGAARLAPTVVVRPEASNQATVIEVRTADMLGVVYLVCSTLAELGISVRSAHVSTVGPQAVDVFYVQEESAGALPDDRAAAAAHAIRERLTESA